MRKQKEGDTHIQLINSPVNGVDDYDKVVIKWAWEDIQLLRPKWSKNKCVVMLDQVAKRLEERSIELGWEVMEMLIQMNEEVDE